MDNIDKLSPEKLQSIRRAGGELEHELAIVKRVAYEMNQKFETMQGEYEMLIYAYEAMKDEVERLEKELKKYQLREIEGVGGRRAAKS